MSIVLDSGEISAPMAMCLDQQLLDTLDSGGELQMHFYNWDSPTLTYGYFFPISEYVNRGAWEAAGGKLARRPTGGGIMFHWQDFAFSILVPRRYPLCQQPLAFRYRMMQETIRNALVAVFPDVQAIVCVEGALVAAPFCMLKPTTCDLILAGQKIAGAAQRLTKQGMLYQVSILIQPAPADHVKECGLDEDLSFHMYKKKILSKALHNPSWANVLLQESSHPLTMSLEQRRELKAQICAQLVHALLF
mgnify:CR=1 FL=1